MVVAGNGRQRWGGRSQLRQHDIQHDIQHDTQHELALARAKVLSVGGFRSFFSQRMFSFLD